MAPPWRRHFGILLAGWGVFNLVEGLVDHQLLGIHHVRDDLGARPGPGCALLDEPPQAAAPDPVRHAHCGHGPHPGSPGVSSAASTS
jgi:Predicted membrane protein (DUF2243)